VVQVAEFIAEWVAAFMAGPALGRRCAGDRRGRHRAVRSGRDDPFGATRQPAAPCAAITEPPPLPRCTPALFNYRRRDGCLRSVGKTLAGINRFMIRFDEQELKQYYNRVLIVKLHPRRRARGAT
jgi:hypothetical protein